MQMSEEKMKGSSQYIQTVEEDRKGRDEREGQDKARTTFLLKWCESWVEKFYRSSEARIKNANLDSKESCNP